MPALDHDNRAADGTVVALHPERPARRPLRQRFDVPVEGRLALAVGLAGFGLWAVVAYLTPPPVHPDAAETWYALALDTMFFGCAFAAGVGLVRCRRWGLLGALGAALTMFTGVVACPVTGHHEVGAWWLVQFVYAGAYAGLTGVSLALSGRGAR